MEIAHDGIGRASLKDGQPHRRSRAKQRGGSLPPGWSRDGNWVTLCQQGADVALKKATRLVIDALPLL
jgi:hypothetical protein